MRIGVGCQLRVARGTWKLKVMDFKSLSSQLRVI